jgi:hypothetical protein
VNREQMIEWLVDDDIQMVGDNLLQEDSWYLYTILRAGFVGYNNFTDNELRAEILERDPDEVLED